MKKTPTTSVLTYGRIPFSGSPRSRKLSPPLAKNMSSNTGIVSASRMQSEEKTGKFTRSEERRSRRSLSSDFNLSPVHKTETAERRNFTENTPSDYTRSMPTLPKPVQATINRLASPQSAYKSPETYRRSEQLAVDISPGKTSVENILAALKQLQIRRKAAEAEIDKTSATNEEMRVAIEQTRRHIRNWTSNADTTLSKELNIVDSKYSAITSDVKRLQSKVEDFEKVTAEKDILISQYYQKVSILTGSLNEINNRKNEITERLNLVTTNLQQLTVSNERLEWSLNRLAGPDSFFDTEIRKLNHAINAKTADLNMDRDLSVLTTRKNKELQEYLELILAVNGDLCSALEAQERTNDIFKRVNKQFQSPRYTWNKKSLPIRDVINVVSTAAETSMQSKKSIESSLAAKILAKEIKLGNDTMESFKFLKEISSKLLSNLNLNIKDDNGDNSNDSTNEYNEYMARANSTINRGKHSAKSPLMKSNQFIPEKLNEYANDSAEIRSLGHKIVYKKRNSITKESSVAHSSPHMLNKKGAKDLLDYSYIYGKLNQSGSGHEIDHRPPFKVGIAPPDHDRFNINDLYI